MLKKYKIMTWMSLKAEIKEVEVEKETDKSIWIKGQRNAKVSDFVTYCDTYEEAKEKLASIVASRIKKAREELEKLKQVEQEIAEL